MLTKEQDIKKILVSKSISKKYEENLILENINFELYSGEIISILGPSGIGKTTFLNILIGLTEQTSGEIINFGNKIGYVFQEDRLVSWLNLFENIKLVQKNSNDNEIFKNLELVGLSDYYNYFPSQLSGGMKHRGSIARALTYAGDIMLLDEPFKSLDIKLRLELLDLMKFLKDTRKIGFILVTHDIEEAVYVSDRILIFKGKPAKIVKEINVSKKRLNNQLKIEDEIILKKEIFESLYN